MLRRSLFLFIVVVVYNTSFAQKSQLELGLNVTNLIKNIVSASSTNNINSEPYTILLRYGDSNSAWRLGVGGYYESTNDNTFSSFGSLNTTNTNINVAFGRERRKQLGYKLRVFYGIEALYSYTSEINVFSEFGNSLSINSTSSYSQKYGLMPFFGLQFQVTPWLGISTKSRLELLREDIKDIIEDRSTGITLGPYYSDNYYVRSVLPSTVFIQFNLGVINKK